MPKALAAPRPVEGDGLLLMPTATLSKFQAVRVVCARTADSEANSNAVRHAMFLIFIGFKLSDEEALVFCLALIINAWVTNKRWSGDNLVTSF
jgi:hypothetical protein